MVVLNILKVTSFQYLYNISEMKLGMEFIFLHGVKHQSFYKLGLMFLMELTKYVQSTKNRKLVIFLQYIKRVSQLLLCSLVMQNTHIFYGHQVYCYLLPGTFRL